MIYSFGSADGYNTELPERLHIDFAKSAYLASNKRDFLEQMAIWLQRQEAIFLRSAYLTWCHPQDNTDNTLETKKMSQMQKTLMTRCPILPKSGESQKIRHLPTFPLTI